MKNGHHHVVPIRVYLLIFLALMAGTALTVLAARVDLGEWNVVVAMTIAALKATLVVLFFMHMKYGEKLNWVFAGAGIVWLIILLALTFADYASRAWQGSFPS